ncbi:hypothetical protein M9Y10_031202 [Tritrichomonas musculus]|uniref:Uncharacterized protein n=1 Tax=Tritrichomonas musculus TaxID=1915356 RepID=A0ABR2H3U5_9EUKA
MLLYLLLFSIKSFPKFTILLADDNDISQCNQISSNFENYFNTGIYKNLNFTRDQASDISKAYQAFLCTYKKLDIDDALENVNKNTEVLIIYAIEVDNEIDFNKLKNKMAVYVLNGEDIYTKLGNSEKPKNMFSQISMLSSSILKVLNDSESYIISKKKNKKASTIEIEGSMSNKVSFLAIFDQYNLKFKSDVDCPYIYLRNCQFQLNSFEIQSANLLVDPISFESLYSIRNKVKISANEFGLIVDKKQTIRLSFSTNNVNFVFSNQDFPQEESNYQTFTSSPIPNSWFKSISVVSLSIQYSLYLTQDFVPNESVLPLINISIKSNDDISLSVLDKENIVIRTESYNQNAWNQINNKPTISLDYNSDQYSVESPNDIEVVNQNSNQSTGINKKKKIIILSVISAAAIAIILIVLICIIVRKNRNKTQVVYINQDSHQGNPSKKDFKDDITKNNDEKELSDQEKIEDDEDDCGPSNHNINAFDYNNQPQNDSFPPPTIESQSYLPYDSPNSAYTTPF